MMAELMIKTHKGLYMPFTKKLMLIILSSALVSTSSYANLDVCNNLPGPWEGDVIVNYVILKNAFRCEYSGKALASTPVSDRSHFTAETTLKLVSGACFPSLQMSLSGTCDGNTGDIYIYSKDANLQGSTDGSVLYLNGKMNINILGKIVVADIEKFEMVKR